MHVLDEMHIFISKDTAKKSSEIESWNPANYFVRVSDGGSGGSNTVTVFNDWNVLSTSNGTS